MRHASTRSLDSSTDHALLELTASRSKVNSAHNSVNSAHNSMLNSAHTLMFNVMLCALCLGGGALSLGCDSNEVVSSVLIEVRTLEKTGADDPHSLTGTGELTLTPYDMLAQTVYNSVNFSIEGRVGNVPELPLGQWRFLITGSHNGTPIFGTSAPFEVNSDEAVSAVAIVGRSECTGLMPLLRGPTGIEGTSDLIYAYDGSASVALSDGRVLIIGGGPVDPVTGRLTAAASDIQIYLPRYGVVTKVAQALAAPRAFHRATLLDDGRILVVGGVTSVVNGSYTMTDQAEILTINDDNSVITTGLLPTMSEGRARQLQHKLSDGSVLIAGGEGAGASILSSSVRFFPSLNGFVPQGNLNFPRVESSVSELGRTQELALISGGLSTSGPTETTELFTVDPNAGCAPAPSSDGRVGCFLVSVPLNRPRWGHNSVFLSDDSVLITGGFQGGADDAPRDPIAQVEQFKFEIITGADGSRSANIVMREVGTLNIARGRASLARLKTSRGGEKFAFVGGEIAGSRPEVTLLNPLSLTSGLGGPVEVAETCPLSEDRYRPMSVTTPDGAVMILGGLKRGQDPASGATLHVASRRIEVIYPNLDLQAISFELSNR